MPDLSEKILALKRKEKSLREIAKILGVSHTTVMRRLREMEQVSLPVIIAEDVTGKADFKPHQSRLTHESDSIGNQVLQKKTPSAMSGDGVTPRGVARRSPQGGKKKTPQEVFLESSDLLSTIREVLEAKGIEMYRMESDAYEGYQARHNRQVIRFYVKREIMMDKGKGEKD